uniref:Uncharacterized protein n=1 Tax=Arundo donax TaxID=35708 RepID=A0A0A9BN61_ARUDO
MLFLSSLQLVFPLVIVGTF